MRNRNYNNGVSKDDKGSKGLPCMPLNVIGYINNISELPDAETVNVGSIYLMQDFTASEAYRTYCYDVYYLIYDNNRKVYYRCGKFIQY